LTKKSLLNKKRISTTIFLFSIFFFYIPSVIIGGVYVILFRNEEIKVNLSLIEKGVKIFETIVYQKKNELLYTTKYLGVSEHIFNSVQNKNEKDLENLIYEAIKEYKFENITIFDKDCKIIFSNKNFFDEYISCSDKEISKVIFFYDRIFFDSIIPIANSKTKYFIYSRYILKTEELNNLLLKNINFSVVEKKSGIRVFTTFAKEKQRKNKLSTPVRQFKNNFFYKYYDFTNIENMQNFIIEVIISPALYRFRIDNIGVLSLLLFLIWILATILFFIVLNRQLVLPIQKLLKAAAYITSGNYKERVRIESKNEIGILANKFNSMALSLEQKEEQLKNLNVRLEKKVIERTKSLQYALDRLRSYDNQKSDFFYTVIHDLKNPMTVINGYASMILQYKNIDEEKRNDFVQKIVKESDRLTYMLNDFLKDIRQENSLSSMELSKIDLVPILEYFYTIYEVQAKEMLVDLVWNVQTPLPPIMGNKEKLEHVISNLLSNAFKFVNERGVIKIGGRIEEDFIKIGISDTGTGIKEGKEKEIFEKFKKYSTITNQNQSGTGLGLYIAKQIIKKHNGEIWVENNKGGTGCTFYFTLPVYKI